MSDEQLLTDLCNQAIKDKNLDDRYKKRLKWELKDLLVKDDCKYFLDLKDKRNLPNNKNVLIPYLLGICNEFDINKYPNFISGDTLDIDIDYLPQIQQHLKNEYVPKTFGEKYVCNIGSHNTLKVKSALLDVVRIYSKDRNEILNITKDLADTNDDGKPLTLDEAEATNKSLQEYLNKNPEVRLAAGQLIGKTRSMGQHAAGVIISSIPLDTFVPLIAGKEGMPCSSWGEGQSSSDLSTVGLIKFDFLGSEAINKIMVCLQLIKQRHNIDKFCALPDGVNWSDISYLNDPKCLEMASKGDLKTVFQFDSDVARNMCKRGGVDSFDDLVAYTSLNRPGCLDMGTDKDYIERKRGKQYESHPILKPILGNSYGLMLFQEQLIRILSTVGKMDEGKCVELQKAISKKKIDKFIKYKDQFIENGQITLNQPKEEVEKIWALIEAMSAYSFNLAHAVSYTYVSSRMLYLKCYYPLEWYAACMSSLKSGETRLQDYRYDGMKHKIIFNRLDINKSKSNFHMAEDNSIYYALSKIKGVGESAAEKIVSLQPFTDFQDFITRFDGSAATIKPLIALRVFPEDSPVNLYKRYERYKADIDSKITTLESNLQEAKDKYKQLIPSEYRDIIKNINDLNGLIDAKVYKKLCKAEEKYNKTLETYIKRLNKLEEYEAEIPEEYEKLLLDQELAEQEYYGFLWDSPLAKMGAEYTFEEFESQNLEVGPVDIQITKVEQKQGKVKFCQITAADVLSISKKINIWNNDYSIWKDELQEGAMLRIQLRAPTGGFPTWTLVSERFKKYTKGVNDFRIVALK